MSLVRGDRFLSYDFNSSTLTNWGVAQLAAIPPGAYGGMFPHLLYNGLPDSFTGTSAYALLPFYTPSAAKDILKGNKVLDQYDLSRPANNPAMISVQSQEGCRKVFEDRENFRVSRRRDSNLSTIHFRLTVGPCFQVMYQAAVRVCTDGHDFMLGWDEQKRHDDRSKMLHSVFFEDNFEANVVKFFSENVRRLIGESSLKYTGPRKSIDIVRDVCNVVPIVWLAEKFALPLKTAAQPHGLITIPQAFDAWLVLFM